MTTQQLIYAVDAMVLSNAIPKVRLVSIINNYGRKTSITFRQFKADEELKAPADREIKSGFTYSFIPDDIEITISFEF